MSYYVIFIHGRGSAASKKKTWERGLLEGLERCAFRFDSVELRSILCSPKYSVFLAPHFEIPEAYQRRQKDRPTSSKRGARQYQKRLEALQEEIGKGFPHDMPARMVKRVTSSHKVAERIIGARYKDVRRYTDESQRRAYIIDEIIDQLPGEGRCVLVAHSLGSIIALDLLACWPKGLHIDLLLTAGSPAALGPVRQHLEGHRSPEFPYQRVSVWVNVYDANDPVTGGSGLEPVLKGTPWEGAVLDHHVENGGARARHDIDRYLDHVLVGRIIGRQLQEYLDEEHREVELPKTPEKLGAWIDFALAQRFRQELIIRTKDDGMLARMRVAAEHARVAAVEALAHPQETELADYLEELLEHSKFAPSDRRKLLIQLRASPPFHPFAIHLESPSELPSLLRLAKVLGLSAHQAKNIHDAVKEAREAHSKDPWPAIALGGAAISLAAVATGGVALLAAPGLVGAAATTSGLAALGSLLGGSMTAGLFVTAGTGALSSGFVLAAVQMLGPQQFEEEVMKIQSEALACWWEHDQDRTRKIMADLKQMHREADRMAREHQALDSGRSTSDVAKGYLAKAQSVKRALSHLEERCK